MKEPQYNAILEVNANHGRTKLGLMANQVWHDDPRRLLFSMARYKFVAKMLVGKESVAEVGCGDGFCSRIVQQEIPNLHLYDFDPTFIEDIKNRNPPKANKWHLKGVFCETILTHAGDEYEAIYCLDVLEHIRPSDETEFLVGIINALKSDGVFIAGMPSSQSQKYASPQSKSGHVNCKTGEGLRTTMLKYFHNVFLFSMSDEVVHTGFSPMAHYLLAICVTPR